MGLRNRIALAIGHSRKTVDQVITAIENDGYAKRSSTTVAAELRELVLSGFVAVEGFKVPASVRIHYLSESGLRVLTTAEALLYKPDPARCADPNAGRLIEPITQPADYNQPPIANLCDAALLTCSPSRRAASAADLAPQAPRRGSQAALALPSRMGDRLHYRDGRITRLDGTLITTTKGNP